MEGRPYCLKYLIPNIKKPYKSEFQNSIEESEKLTTQGNGRLGKWPNDALQMGGVIHISPKPPLLSMSQPAHTSIYAIVSSLAQYFS
jgi:hypothetical protein